MNGRNFLIDMGGRKRKHGFYQNIVLEAETVQNAGHVAKAKIIYDKDLKEMTMNATNDPPVVELHTFWELDIAEDVSGLELGRTFYEEKKWWQFWKKTSVPPVVQAKDMMKE